METGSHRIPATGRRLGARGRAVGWLLVVAGAAGVSGFTAAVPDRLGAPPPRFDGEYGLFVREAGAELEVRWLTAERTPGRLEVVADGEVVGSFETPKAVSHAVSFRRPEAQEVLLEYGSASEGAEDGHRTHIYFDGNSAVETPVYYDVDSLFVVGDTHGEFDVVVRLLQNAGLVDADRRWSGGTKHLVFLGDLFDRGQDVTRLLWFAYGLEREAAAAGGQLHVMLGNHEIMVMAGDLRYVNGKERLLAHRHGVDYSELFDPRTSILGQWLASKPGLVKIDEVLLAHGGLSPRFAEYSLREFQDSLSSYMREETFVRWMDSTYWAKLTPETALKPEAYKRRQEFFWGDESVFWYRDYVNRGYRGPTLQRILDKFDAKVHVIGHTTVGTIEQRFGGSLIAVDMEEPGTEMLLLARSEKGRKRYRYGPTGPPVALEVPSGVYLRDDD